MKLTMGVLAVVAAAVIPVPGASAHHLSVMDASQCSPADLKLTLGPQISPMTGEQADAFMLMNRSATPCAVDSYPRVQLLHRSQRLAFVNQTNGPYVTTRKPEPVMLAPGHRAYFLVAKYRCDGGVLTRATSIRVRLPMSRDELAVSLNRGGVSELDYCKEYHDDQPIDRGNRVAVSPVEASLPSTISRS